MSLNQTQRSIFIAQGFIVAYFVNFLSQFLSLGLFAAFTHFFSKSKSHGPLLLTFIGLALGNYVQLSLSHDKVTSFGQTSPSEIRGTLVSDPQLSSKGRLIVEIKLDSSKNRDGIIASARGTLFLTADASELGDFSDYYTGSLVTATVSQSGGLSSPRLVRPAQGLLGLRAKLLARMGLDPRQAQNKAWGLWWALCLGRQDFVDPYTRDAFYLAGATHVLALSGTHLSLLGFIVLLVLKRFLGRTVALIMSSLIAVFFVFVAGPYPSVVRALCMFILAACQVLLYGRVRLLDVLLQSLPISLVLFPSLATSLGFWLSVGSLLGIVVGVRHLEPLFVRGCKPILGKLLCTGFCAFVSTSPILLTSGLPLRPIAIVSGIALVPLTLIFMGFGFLVPLLGLVSPEFRVLFEGFFDRFFDLIQFIAKLFVF